MFSRFAPIANKVNKSPTVVLTDDLFATKISRGLNKQRLLSLSKISRGWFKLRSSSIHCKSRSVTPTPKRCRRTRIKGYAETQNPALVNPWSVLTLLQEFTLILVLGQQPEIYSALRPNCTLNDSVQRWRFCHSCRLGPFQTASFLCAKSNGNKFKQRLLLINVRFGAWKVRRLKRALIVYTSVWDQLSIIFNNTV